MRACLRACVALTTTAFDDALARVSRTVGVVSLNNHPLPPCVRGQTAGRIVLCISLSRRSHGAFVTRLDSIGRELRTGNKNVTAVRLVKRMYVQTANYRYRAPHNATAFYARTIRARPQLSSWSLHYANCFFYC